METVGHLKILYNQIEDDKPIPRCPHGPTLMFERQVEGGDIKKFFACSAYRNRNDCSFYHEINDKITQAKMFKWRQREKSYVQEKDCNTSYRLVNEFLKEESEMTGLLFCHQCGQVWKGREDNNCQIVNHDLVTLTRNNLLKPSSIIHAKNVDKKEAQYFFSHETISFITETINSHGFTDVLCLGCPSIFENLPRKSRTLLMDIDPRFANFYSQDEFIWYNFFNGHFFKGSEYAKRFQNFLINCDKLLIILDPPFGAKTDLIHNSLTRVLDQLSSLSITATPHSMWIFPYYMERQISQHCPNLLMSDYRVTYNNHTQFGTGTGARKLGSPVRLFTDIPLRTLTLPGSAGYRHCVKCDLWVSEENLHCEDCGKCTSKDGRTYVHCLLCKRCVKPTYQHCEKCQRCKLADHKCNGNNVVINNKKEADKDMKKDAIKSEIHAGKRKKKIKRTRSKRRKTAKSINHVET